MNVTAEKLRNWWRLRRVDGVPHNGVDSESDFRVGIGITLGNSLSGRSQLGQRNGRQARDRAGRDGVQIHLRYLGLTCGLPERNAVAVTRKYVISIRREADIPQLGPADIGRPQVRAGLGQGQKTFSRCRVP